MTKYYVGVDVGGTSIKLAIIDRTGEIVKKWEIPTNTKYSGVLIPEDIFLSVSKELQKDHLTLDDLIGIGIGAPGTVDIKTGLVAEAFNIGWEKFDLSGKLNRKTNLPVFVENDANLAAIGEYWKGAGRGVDSLLAITLGTGIGGGIIINGQILNGANGTAAEIGHVNIERENGALCSCGKKGCIQTIASATGIVRLAHNLIKSNQQTALKSQFYKYGSISAKDVFDLAAKGDEGANTIISYMTDALGSVIANLAITINPTKIVIGGGVSKAGNSLLVPLQNSFNNYALKRTQEATELVIAQLGNDAGVVGGAFIVKSRIN